MQRYIRFDMKKGMKSLSMAYDLKNFRPSAVFVFNRHEIPFSLDGDNVTLHVPNDIGCLGKLVSYALSRFKELPHD